MKKILAFIVVFFILYFLYSETLKKDNENGSKVSFVYKSLARITGTFYKYFEKTSFGRKFSDYIKTEGLVKDVLNNYQYFDKYQIKIKREGLLKEKEKLKSASFVRKYIQGKFIDISINLLNNELERVERIKNKGERASLYKEVIEEKIEKKNFLKSRKGMLKEIE
ncbi:MAG: hypothetical protein A3C43_03325 [Candidatus Schekmanbacteria bacterium RIFCSPHIGHO2_02_FULL_38_11]|uniref:Uncharacterized protein n=1 Tax=Candidatus Schekmanbacteria bacterium RIFCSPLOWO2_12_FULL_38_15 TaxID=1817883 RepID=A0A1F7SPX3_9BACT|nr:MAG: hypothetical protein A2043_03090 [Candidatus Schekmanbacteria bacterium GWA2_38_9]OGL50123.1 MAG: hypothetical protein A3H37_07410 [Candidatus Schekmanbacteria bacterium RIFCSPLOWO2_02_FULL_38_14]OGL54308.1 MAG: hypothetical protein A3C43_03325 [Candidatus Schekmanbacteria bacterium RIFCSPHIGHO2_02_FULL_38_11]OGL55234.1 MAG: hypothetical protein A3G31_09705 [Candidatus Schekmanbacteria bacterium RIFCSPLOWO2_12_FULL_38_15]